MKSGFGQKMRELIKRRLSRIIQTYPEFAVKNVFLTQSYPIDKLADFTLKSTLNAIEPSPERLIANYLQGAVMLGYDKIIWESFPERAIITAESAHIPKRVSGYLRNNEYVMKMDERFEEVIHSCQRKDRWTWITEPLMQIYLELHRMGFAHSYEAYQGSDLVGGFFGFQVGSTFSVSSMFHTEERAGTIAFAHLVNKLKDGEYRMIECGILRPHFERFGAFSIPKEEFIQRVVCGLN